MLYWSLWNTQFFPFVFRYGNERIPGWSINTCLKLVKKRSKIDNTVLLYVRSSFSAKIFSTSTVNPAYWTRDAFFGSFTSINIGGSCKKMSKFVISKMYKKSDGMSIHGSLKLSDAFRLKGFEHLPIPGWVNKTGKPAAPALWSPFRVLSLIVWKSCHILESLHAN